MKRLFVTVGATRRWKLALLLGAVVGALAATGVGASAAVSGGDAITNGGFETGDFTGWTTFTTPNGAIGSPNGATGDAGVALFDTTGNGVSYAAHFSVGEIAGQVGGGPPEGGGIFQNVTVPAGTYVASADVATFGGNNGDCGTYELLIDGSVVYLQDMGQCIAIGTHRSQMRSNPFVLGAGQHEVRILITRRAGPDLTMTQYVDNVALVPSDATAPTITTPGPIVVDATTSAGAIVNYSVTATDPDDPVASVTCTPSSGITFPIGTTTVDCTAADTHGNSATSSFTVHVKGAAEQLNDLLATVTVIGPGTSLAHKVAQAQSELAANDLSATCSKLTAFANQVNAQSGRSIQAGQAMSLNASANRIGTVLGC